MEEILSSIKRIIAEEGDTPGRSRRPSRAMSAPVDRDLAAIYPDDEMDDEEILELSDPIPMTDRTPRAPKSPVLSSIDAASELRQPAPRSQIAAESSERAAVESTAKPIERPSERPIVSPETAAATRAPLEALTRMMVKPDAGAEPGSDGTIEGLVREMLRPILREWIDANLPGMVEDMVAREIAKIMNEQS